MSQRANVRGLKHTRLSKEQKQNPYPQGGHWGTDNENSASCYKNNTG